MRRALLAVLLLVGCAERPELRCPPDEPAHFSAGGQAVSVRTTLDAAEVALFGTKADAHPLPADWTYVVEPPGWTYAGARAVTIYECKQVRFAWVPEPWLSIVMSHESGHAWTGDPCHDHPPEDCR